MTPTLTIKQGEANKEKNYQIIRFIGEFDKAGHMDIKDELDAVVKDFEFKDLIFDFTDLKFINSESIGYLMEIHAHLVKREKKLILIKPDAHVKEVLKTIGIDEVIPMYPSLDGYLNK
ncbi:MAG: STAS domain-containing protein [Candidatus Gracilibacteria bacterium]